MEILRGRNILTLSYMGICPDRGNLEGSSSDMVVELPYFSLVRASILRQGSGVSTLPWRQKWGSPGPRA